MIGGGGGGGGGSPMVLRWFQTTVQLTEVCMSLMCMSLVGNSHQLIFTDFTLSIETYN